MNTAKRPRPWTPRDDQFLVENWPILSLSEIAAILTRNVENTCRRAQRLNLPSKLRKFSPSEDAFLRENWGKARRAWISERLNRTEQVCQQRAARLGLTKGNR